MSILNDIARNPAPLAFVAVPVLFGAAGALEGWALSLIFTSVTVAGHALILGALPVVGAGMFLVAYAISNDAGISGVFAVLGAYPACYAVTNLLGFSVSFLAPIVGFGVLTVIVLVVGLIFSICLPGLLVGGGLIAMGLLSVLKR
jgi:hypothetical protein